VALDDSATIPHLRRVHPASRKTSPFPHAFTDEESFPTAPLHNSPMSAVPAKTGRPCAGAQGKVQRTSYPLVCIVPFSLNLVRPCAFSTQRRRIDFSIQHAFDSLRHFASVQNAAFPVPHKIVDQHHPSFRQAAPVWPLWKITGFLIVAGLRFRAFIRSRLGNNLRLTRRPSCRA